jgi:hypothetical protein
MTRNALRAVTLALPLVVAAADLAALDRSFATFNTAS